jgi:hypothetical protein
MYSVIFTVTGCFRARPLGLTETYRPFSIGPATSRWTRAGAFSLSISSADQVERRRDLAVDLRFASPDPAADDPQNGKHSIYLPREGSKPTDLGFVSLS